MYGASGERLSVMGPWELGTVRRQPVHLGIVGTARKYGHCQWVSREHRDPPPMDIWEREGHLCPCGVYGDHLEV